MSRIGRIPVAIPEGVTINARGNLINVMGPKGEMSYTIPSRMKVVVKKEKVVVLPEGLLREEEKPLYGLVRATIANLMIGVSRGFEKKLELSGVGYRALVSGNELVLSVGFSHPVKVPSPQGIQFLVEENVIRVSGIDKALVGDTASKIRAIRPPEPYKGKGIKYVGEYIRRKAGKVAKAVGTK